MSIQWNDSYRLGIPTLDEDHRALVERLNIFFRRAEDGAPARELALVLADLVEAIALHFAREEALLDRHNYPGLPSHAAEHRRQIQQMRHFQQPYQDGTAARELTMDMAHFLHHWLLDHIQSADIPFKPYLMRIA